MARPSMAPLRTALAVALLAAIPAGAQAARIGYEVGIGVLRSDNIGLDATDEQDETVVSPQLRFDISQDGSVFSLDGRGQLQYLDYLDDTFDDGFRGAFSGQALWTMIPERLQWTFEDYLSRQPIDTFAAFSPENEQQTNLFVTGPSLFLQLGATTRGQLDLRYSNSYAEENESFDSDRYNAAVRVLRDLSPTRILSANVEATRVSYDAAGMNADYVRYDGYARYWSRLRVLELTVDVGYSRLELRDRPTHAWQPLARADLAWRFSARSTLDFAASYELSDAADNLVVDNDDAEPVFDDAGNPTVPVGPEVFKQRRLELGYRYTGERLGFQVRPFYQHIGYLEWQQQDETSRGGFVEATYQVRPRTVLSLAAAREDRRFDDLSRRDRDFTASLALDHQFTRHWSARVELQRRERDSSIIGQGYDENAAILGVSYRR